MSLVEYMISSTALGYISVMAKQLINGIEPSVPKDPKQASKLFLRAMLQGGGMGLYGDYIFGEFGKYGRTFTGQLLGPTFGTVDDVAVLFAKLRSLDDPSTAALNLVRRNTPFINMWYLKAGINYMFIYGLQDRINPGSIRRMEKRMREEDNARFIFSPTEHAARF